MTIFKTLNRVGDNDRKKLTAFGYVIISILAFPFLFWAAYLFYLPYKKLFDLIISMF